jgi:hypothetical protein
VGTSLRTHLGLCGEKNPLVKLRKMPLIEFNTPAEIIVCFTRGGTIAHALHLDCKTVLGPWTKFASGETLEKALRYLGATEEQITAHQKTMKQTGQGSSHLRLMPNRKNLLSINWDKL